MALETDKKISLAVLPLKNLSSNQENEFFCDGMTEEIIDALSKIDQLKVISRTSSFFFKNHQFSLGEIAEKLGVSVILEGSVRVSGEALRIQVRLIDVREDTHFWSERWERKKDHLFEVQDEISLLIADKLREQVGHLTISDHLVDISTRNLTAYEHYLKGRFHARKWNPEDANIALEQYEKAIALDPELIDGYLGLADSYSFLAVAGFAPRKESWQKTAEALQTAKAINPSHASLNYILGNQAFFYKGNFGEAITYYQQSLATKPTYSEAHQFTSYLYSLKGDFKKAYQHIQYAKSVDPLNPETRYFEASYFYRIGDYDSAKIILDDLLKDNDKNLPAIVLSIYIKIKENQLADALKTIEGVPMEIFTPGERLGLLALIDVLSGNHHSSYFRKIEEDGKDSSAHFAHSYLFIIYANLGRNDAAFAILEQLFQSGSSILLLSFNDPLSDPIKSDPRYQAYHSRVYPDTVEKAKLVREKPDVQDDGKAEAEVERLNGYMEMERPFLNPALSLRSLAEQVEIHPNRLSWLLNQFVGKNFNEFINQARIEHFKKLVIDPANSHISLIGLAYESGFNSKTVFNTAFKKETGMTPREYQKGQV
jgi:adenylate cyclase